MFPVLAAGLLPEVYDLLVAGLTANLALRDTLPSSPGFDGQCNQLLKASVSEQMNTPHHRL